MPARHRMVGCLAALLGVFFMQTVQGQAYSVSFRVDVTRGQPAVASHNRKVMSAMRGSSSVVAWLTPFGAADGHTTLPASPNRGFELVQKNKQFTPHLLIVPAGSAVSFPNLDSFFHNVFSLFNGRRFDLGLYESGERRSVRFEHEGVSYIFCNIHPEMGAVIVALGTPFYTVSGKDGSLTLENVPSGTYQLHVWSENVAAADLVRASQMVRVSTQNIQLETMTFKESVAPFERHLNKFGEEYKKSDENAY
jgi:plastocyanin